MQELTNDTRLLFVSNGGSVIPIEINSSETIGRLKEKICLRLKASLDEYNFSDSEGLALKDHSVVSQMQPESTIYMISNEALK